LKEFILFFSSPRKKEEGNPTYIAAHLPVRQADLQATRANAATNIKTVGMQKSLQNLSRFFGSQRYRRKYKKSLQYKL